MKIHILFLSHLISVGTLLAQFPGDLNQDGLVNLEDLDFGAPSWTWRLGDPGFDPNFDINGDQTINTLDFLYVVDNFSNITITGTNQYCGDLTITYETENIDPGVTIYGEYSLDGPAGPFSAATPAIPPDLGQFVWDSHADLPDQSQSVVFKIGVSPIANKRSPGLASIFLPSRKDPRLLLGNQGEFYRVTDPFLLDNRSLFAIQEAMVRDDYGTTGDEWVELVNLGSCAANLDGYFLSDEDGNFFDFPVSLPDVPPGALVVVYFDGGGSDDLDFSDGVASLHASAQFIFEDDFDQVALYDAGGGIHDFIAYGADAGADDDNAAQQGHWQDGDFLETGGAMTFGSVELLPGGSLGFFQDNWIIYQPQDVSPGAINHLETPLLYGPEDQAVIIEPDFVFSWRTQAGGDQVRLQIDDDFDFSSPLVDQTVSNDTNYFEVQGLVDGNYFWRVKNMETGGLESPFTEVRTFEVQLVDLSRFSEKINARGAVTPLLQRKDTRLLCMGSARGRCAQSGTHRWDQGHPTTGNPRNTHGGNNCAKACIQIVNNHLGGSLTQDEISYQIHGGGTSGPDGDLGHNTPTSLPQLNATLPWAVSTANSTDQTPTFAELETWLDASPDNLAILAIQGNGVGHAVVAYFTLDIPILGEFVRVADPWTSSRDWHRYSTYGVFAHWLCGGTGIAGADVTSDGDGDGIANFDENNRFCTAANQSDSDGDGVPDKIDIQSYRFPNPMRPPRAVNPVADIDGDGLRAECDPDSDNGLVADGDEDTNKDGIFNAANERDPYLASDDGFIKMTLTWDKNNTDVDLWLENSGEPGNKCYYANRTPDWGSPGAGPEDPELDYDDTNGFGPEHITTGGFIPGTTYTARVHYYSDHGNGPTTARCIVAIGNRVLIDASRTLTDNQVWTVLSFDSTSRVVVDRVTTLENTPPPKDR